ILQCTEVTDELIQEQIDELINQEKIIQHNGNLYLPSLYYAESRFSNRIVDMLAYEKKESVTDAEIMELVGEIEDEESLSYGSEQFEAIKKAIHSPLMILT